MKLFNLKYSKIPLLRPSLGLPKSGHIRVLLNIEYAITEKLFWIASTVILSLPLIQEGQLSVSGKRMCTTLVNCLEVYAYLVNVWLGKLTTLDMTPLG